MGLEVLKTYALKSKVHTSTSVPLDISEFRHIAKFSFMDKQIFVDARKTTKPTKTLVPEGFRPYGR